MSGDEGQLTAKADGLGYPRRTAIAGAHNPY